MVLTHNYIKEQNLTTAKELLAKCLANPEIELPLIHNPNLHTKVEDLANTICYLEDHIRYLEQVSAIEKANSARWANLD